MSEWSRGTVLITRPEPAAHETAARAVAMGLHPLLAPMMTIRPSVPLAPNRAARRVALISGRARAAAWGPDESGLAEGIGAPMPRLPDRGPPAWAGVLVTSSNALPALGPAFHAIPLWAVGRATAERARSAGFAEVHSAEGDAEALAELIVARLRPSEGSLLLASGRGQGRDLAAVLRARGFRIIRRIAYAAEPARVLPEAAVMALRAGSVGHALFFSADTAHIFVRLVRRAGLASTVTATAALAISRRTEVALRGLPWRRIGVAAKPDQDSLLALLS